jgi:hypothetical protein
MVNSSAGKLIAAFVLLLLGIVFIAQAASMGSAITSRTAVNNEAVSYTSAFQETSTQINTTVSFTLANNPTGWKSDDCPLTGVVFTNSSGTAWTSGTDYTLTASTGVFTLGNTILVNATTTNQTYVDYQYCGNDYMNLSWGRTGINLVPGFFALALLLISVGLFYNIAKENGIIS